MRSIRATGCVSGATRRMCGVDCHGAARLAMTGIGGVAMTGIGGVAMPRTSAPIPKTFVIASEARQSRQPCSLPRRFQWLSRFMDCHGASRLAMTGIGGVAMPRTSAPIPKTFVIASEARQYRHPCSLPRRFQWLSRFMDCIGAARLAMTGIGGVAVPRTFAPVPKTFVIASEARQSRQPCSLPRRFQWPSRFMDCHGATRLAMTMVLAPRPDTVIARARDTRQSTCGGVVSAHGITA
jgi:hypothetical protein